MTDRDHHDDNRRDREIGHDEWREQNRARQGQGQGQGQSQGQRASGAPRDFEETAYGRPETGVSNRSEGMGYGSGGYGDQGGYGSQHGQGGYASPAQGSRYGQTGADWGRAGYGEEPNRPGLGDSGRGASGRGDDLGRGGSRGRGGEYGFQGQGGGEAQWGGARGFGEGGYGAGGGTYGQDDYGAGAQRSRSRLDQHEGTGATGYADVRGRTGASGPAHEAKSDPGAEHDHDPSYRRWRDEQLSNHDREYGTWRTSQAQRYDDDYKRYRDERHSHFRNTFEDWRNKNAAQPDEAHPSSQAAKPVGQAGAGTGAASGALESDSRLQNVSDGGSGHADHDQTDAKTS